MRVRIAVFISLLLLLLPACDPTPSSLERWANRPGSEERFIGFLQDPGTSPEVNRKALELLIAQWSYSAEFLRDGRAVREMPDASQRDRVLREVEPFLRERMALENLGRYQARDATVHLLQASDTPEIRTLYLDLLDHWTREYWDLAYAAGATSSQQLFNVLGQERGEVHLARALREERIDDIVFYFVDRVRGVEWLAQSDAVVEAFRDRWENNMPAPGDRVGETARLRFQEAVALVVSNPSAKAWFLDAAEDEELAEEDPGSADRFRQLLARNTSEADIDAFAALIAQEGSRRWRAAFWLIALEDADGLARAMEALSSAGELGYWSGDEEPDEDGFLQAAAFLCSQPVIANLGEDARRIFLRHAARGNVAQRALSLACLGEIGTAADVAALQEIHDGLGDDAPAVPRWAEDTTLADLAALAIQSARART